MGQFQVHCFVCTSGKTCPRQGSTRVLDQLRVLVKEAGLTDSIRINQSGCFSQCGYGPMIVVYPENVWYAAVREEDAREIFEQHLKNGKVVERLVHRPPGPGKQICPKGKETIPPVAEVPGIAG